ncbi:MAG TPA: alpha/beta hydrolase [Thermoanaerobaculia bacterium]|nr:alpha/beta hydrolase [Thermoanaerobaculia bacterium]
MIVIVKLVMILALLVITAVAGGALFVGLVKRTSLFYPERYPAGNWEVGRLAVRPDDHFFPSGDGTRLHAWSFRATDPSAPTLIWFHGNGNNISERGTHAARLAQKGLNVFLFDYRGYGRSEGVPTEAALYLDSIAAYDFVADALSRPRPSIAVYGESLGGAYAAWVARERPVRCVVIENSFPSLQSVGRMIYPNVPLHLYVRKSLRTLDWLNDAGRPVLVMHGARDTTLPISLGRELFAALRVPKRLLISETAGHCQIPSLEGDRYDREVLAFVASPPAAGETLAP